jgi:citrate lyase beta subunit
MEMRKRLACHFIHRRLFSSSSSPHSVTARPRRALFNVPGADPRKLAKARDAVAADSIVLDLEDGVAPSQKTAARNLVAQELRLPALSGSRERAVRINDTLSPFFHDDMKAIIAAHTKDDDGNSNKNWPDTIVIPKVNTVNDVHAVETYLPEKSNIRLIACIESARALINVER